MSKPKSSTSTAPDKCCVFCKKSDSDQAKYGGLKTTKNTHAHYFCLLLSTKIKQSGSDRSGILGFLSSDIRNELQRTEKIFCCYCNKPHANIYCSVKRCKKVFHLPCGLENNSSHSFTDSFKSFCHNHRHSQRISTPLKRNITELSCLICTVPFTKDDLNKVFWPGCCRPQGLLHRYCVQRYTMSAGYYTKCPTCSNNSTFTNNCKEFGVFVPEQDASWEREPNAYSELYNPVVSQCSYEPCICSNGRTFNRAYGRWFIINCFSCGSSGAHRGCCRGEAFICTTCKTIHDQKGFKTPSYEHIDTFSSESEDEINESINSCDDSDAQIDSRTDITQELSNLQKHLTKYIEMTCYLRTIFQGNEQPEVKEVIRDSLQIGKNLFDLLKSSAEYIEKKNCQEDEEIEMKGATATTTDIKLVILESIKNLGQYFEKACSLLTTFPEREQVDIRELNSITMQINKGFFHLLKNSTESIIDFSLPTTSQEKNVGIKDMDAITAVNIEKAVDENEIAVVEESSDNFLVNCNELINRHKLSLCDNNIDQLSAESFNEFNDNLSAAEPDPQESSEGNNNSTGNFFSGKREQGESPQPYKKLRD